MFVSHIIKENSMIWKNDEEVIESFKIVMQYDKNQINPFLVFDNNNQINRGVDKVVVGSHKKIKITVKKYMDEFINNNQDVTSSDYAEKILNELLLILPTNGPVHSLELMKKEYNTLKNDK